MQDFLYSEGFNVINPFTMCARNTCIVFFFSLLTDKIICCRVFMAVEDEIQAPHKPVKVTMDFYGVII